MNKYIYVINGSLKNGSVKIGSTGDCDGIRTRYQTYYGDEMKIYYAHVEDGCKAEKTIHDILESRGCLYSNELYNCSCLDARHLIREVTDVSKLKTC